MSIEWQGYDNCPKCREFENFLQDTLLEEVSAKINEQNEMVLQYSVICSECGFKWDCDTRVKITLPK